jgi:O-antigen/teichoic acid export membrane protein
MRRFSRMLISSYAATGVGVLYSFLSVPLALHYLTKQQFGLWAVMTQITGYLLLVDFGMSSSIARLLIDHKDHPETGAYGSLIKTGWLVSLVQGGLILALGMAGSRVAAQLLDIPDALRADFVSLLQWQCLIQAGSVILKSSGYLLYAHQRYDIVNYGSTVQLGTSLLVLWLSLERGAGVYSVLWVNATALVPAHGMPAWCSWRLGLWPKAGQWGRCTWRQFAELWSYSKDVFLIALGTQFMLASQTIIITRRCGLEVAAVWSVGTRMLQLSMQLLWRVFDFSMPALAEMIARQETDRLRVRFRSLTTLSLSMAGVVAVLLALCNASFVHIWTQGKIAWTPTNDVLLAIWLVILAIGRPHNSLTMAVKQIGAMRYIYFVEGALFIGVGLWTVQWGGIGGLIGTSIVCAAFMSVAYGIWRSTGYFRIRPMDILWDWQKPMLMELMILVPLTMGTIYFSGRPSSWIDLLLQGAFITVAALFVFWRVGVPLELRHELVDRLPAPVRRWFPFRTHFELADCRKNPGE